MAMQFIDGFDYLTVANFNLKWDNAPGGSVVTGVYSKGKAWSIGSTNLTKTLGANFTTGMVAFHGFISSTFASGSLIRFINSGTQQVDLRINASGNFFFTQNGTTIGTTSSFAVTPNTWYWFEVQVTISTATAGVANLYVGGTSILAQSGLTTGTVANQFNQIQISGQNSGNDITQVDSFHFWDGTAGDVTAFPYGEHIVDTQLANAVGSNATWTKGGTTINTNNFQQVNEANEDGDATYVATATVNNIDSYGFANLAESSGTIGTIATNTIDRIDDAGSHTFDHFTKSAAATALSSAVTPTASYVNHQKFFGTDPNTSAAWTISGRNAAEFGYKLIT